MAARVPKSTSRIRTVAGTAWWYARTISHKLSHDDVLFLASGIAFNGILTLIPLLLLGASALGMFLHSSELAVARMHSVLNSLFPPQPFATSIKESIITIISDITANRTSLGIFGVVVLIYTATSLFDAVRSALHKVYGLHRTRNVFASFVRHLGFVVLVFILFLVSSVSVWVISTLEGIVVHVPALSFIPIPRLHTILPTIITLVLDLFMFYVLYRHIPDAMPPRDASIISTATATLLWFISGKIFALYLSTFSSIGTIYGPYAFILVLLIWVYYSSLVLVIGAVVGQVHWERSRTINRSLMK